MAKKTTLQDKLYGLADRICERAAAAGDEGLTTGEIRARIGSDLKPYVADLLDGLVDDGYLEAVEFISKTGSPGTLYVKGPNE